MGEQNMSCDYTAWRALVLICRARVCWELENHQCANFAWIWPLHNVWHLGSCLAANDVFVAGYLYRIEKLGVRGVVSGHAMHNSLPKQLPALFRTPVHAMAMLESPMNDK